MGVDVPKFFANTTALTGIGVLCYCFSVNVFQTALNIVANNDVIDFRAVHADTDADEDTAEEEPH